MDDINGGDILQKLKEIFEAVIPKSNEDSYPKEALPLGTYVRPTRYDKLGVITDAFYGDIDKDNQKIIVYTILLFPRTDSFSGVPKMSEQHYVTNEYEYEIVAYLMIPPINLAKLTAQLGGGLFYES